jgi:hypothetical protein
MAGMSFCELEQQCGNPSWNESVLISTTVGLSTRTATVVYSRSNGTMLFIGDLSEPTSITIGPSELRAAMSRFFAYLDPSNVNSTTTDALMYTVASLVSPTVDPTGIAQTFLQNFVILPLFLFNANNNPDSDFDGTSPIPNLPDELYATLELSTIGSRVLIAPWTAMVYSAIVIIVSIFCLLLLCWGLNRQGPNISSFPLVDFAARVCSAGTRDDGLARIFAETAATNEIQNHLDGVRLYLGGWDIEQNGGAGTVKRMGFQTRPFPRESLIHKGETYEW